jgi:cytochrome P450
MDQMNTLNDFIAPFVERAIQMSTSQIEGKEVLEKEEEQNFTYSLSLFTRDRKVLRDQLMSSLLAGRDTTACTLSWLFYELSYHPKVYSRLREEVIRTVGVDGKPTYEDLKGMKYLQWCLNESIPPFVFSV